MHRHESNGFVQSLLDPVFALPENGTCPLVWTSAWPLLRMGAPQTKDAVVDKTWAT